MATSAQVSLILSRLCCFVSPVKLQRSVLTCSGLVISTSAFMHLIQTCLQRSSGCKQVIGTGCLLKSASTFKLVDHLVHLPCLGSQPCGSDRIVERARHEQRSKAVQAHRRVCIRWNSLASHQEKRRCHLVTPRPFMCFLGMGRC